MEVVFNGSCDVCKMDNKLLISLPKETAKTLNITYGLNISNPVKWRICANCNYEICNIVMKYLEKSTSHHALSVDSSKCCSCGDCRIVQDPTIAIKIIEIREIGLAVPLSSANYQACFTCLHIIDTVIKYKNMLQASDISQLSIQSFQNLTKSINIAKQSSNVRRRKNPRPVKLQPQVRECVVKLKKLDFSTLNDILADSPVGASTPKSLEKRQKKPIKLHQGRSWTNSGLQNGLSPTVVKKADTSSKHYKTLDFPTNMESVDSDISQTLGVNKRRVRAKKRSMLDDFIYFDDNEKTPKKKSKSLPKPITNLKEAKSNSKNYSDIIIPCVVVIERVTTTTHSIGNASMASNSTNVESLQDPINETSTETEISILQDQQNENSTPNIPNVPQETPTKFVFTEEIFSSSSSSSSFKLSGHDGRTPIKSILTPERYRSGNNGSKNVSFSDHNELIYYEPERVSSNGIEIELADLDDHISEEPKTNEIDEIDEFHNDQDKIIEEIVAQQF